MNSYRCLIIEDASDTPKFSLQHPDQSPSKEHYSLVKLNYAALNQADLLYPRNKYFDKPSKGSRMGFEASGVVIQSHPNSSFSEGQAVAICPLSIDINTQGTLAQYGQYRDDQLIPTPTALSDQASSAFWMSYMTAWASLIKVGGLEAGQWTCINAATSNVGMAAIQVAKAVDAKVIAVARKREHESYLKQIGADVVLMQPENENDYFKFTEDVKHCTAAGIDLSLDAVAGPNFRALTQAAKTGGTIITHGLLDRQPMDVHAGVLMKKDLCLRGFKLDHALTSSEQISEAHLALTDYLDKNAISDPKLGATFGLKEYQRAFDELKRPSMLGKITLDLNN